MKGILDRFEGDKAVILIEEENAELIVNKTDLPLNSEVNTIFLIEKKADDYQIIKVDDAATNQAKEKSTLLMDKLRAKSSGSKFKRQ
jgi:Ser/Thr protein kinase RdoA (MazF antagonist)